MASRESNPHAIAITHSKTGTANRHLGEATFCGSGAASLVRDPVRHDRKRSVYTGQIRRRALRIAQLQNAVPEEAARHQPASDRQACAARAPRIAPVKREALSRRGSETTSGLRFVRAPEPRIRHGAAILIVPRRSDLIPHRACARRRGSDNDGSHALRNAAGVGYRRNSITASGEASRATCRSVGDPG